jgi:hypothetical protein
MAKRTNAVTRAFRKLGRAFAAKDERAFEDAMDELEEHVEEPSEDEQPEIEVHNHVPDYRGMDNGRGELPEKDPPGFDRAHDEEEMPPWFKKEKEANDKRFKAMSDTLEELRKGDRRNKDGELPEELEEHEFGKGEDETASEENLEMDRHRDRSRDEPSEREEMAERIKERGGDRRRNADKRDEANKEILGELEFEAPPGTGDKARRATDSRYLEDAFQDTLSKAEVLAPGIALPTFDSKASPVRTFGQIARLRQTALDLAYNKAGTRGVIDAAMGGRTMDSKRMSHASTRVLFNAAASTVGSSNNHRATDRSSYDGGGTRGGNAAGGIQSIAELNKVNREKYAAKH